MGERIGRLIGATAACFVLAGALLGIPACRRIVAEVQEQHHG